MKCWFSLLIFLNIIATGFSQKEIDLRVPYSFEWKNETKRDWSFLENVLEGKNIVGLGESLHGAKEYSEVKLELIKYLHEALGFNVLAMECDMGLLGIANLTRDQFSDSLFLQKTFYPIWHTEANLKLVKYLKRNPNLKIIGFDMQFFSIDTYKGQLKNITNTEKLEKLTDFQKLAHYYKTIKSRYSEKGLIEKRDSIMAKNLEWIISDFYKNEKVIVWAANAHLSKVKNSEFSFMGELMANKYGDKFYSIGLFHSLGNPMHVLRDTYYINNAELLPELSLQGKLLESKKQNLFIDFKNLKQTKKMAWIYEKVNHVIDTERTFEVLNLSRSFDAIVWFREVTHPTYLF